MTADVEARTLEGPIRPYDDEEEALMSYEGGRNAGPALLPPPPRGVANAAGRPQPAPPAATKPALVPTKGGSTLMMAGMSGLVLTPLDESSYDQS